MQKCWGIGYKISLSVKFWKYKEHIGPEWAVSSSVKGSYCE